MVKPIIVSFVVLLAGAGTVLGQPATSRSAGPAGASNSSAHASNQFPSEQAAKSHCPSDTVVWANTGGSKAYHSSGDKYFGKTRHGAYMCQKDAEQAGYHASGHGASASAAKTGAAKSTR